MDRSEHSFLTKHRLRIEWKQLVQLGFVFVAIFLLLPHLMGTERVLRTLQHANLIYLTLALGGEMTRYVFSAASTMALALIFGRLIPLSPTIQAFFAGAATNRTFSTGGAPGMFIRLLYLVRQGVSAGSVAALYLIEDIVGFVIGALFLFLGTAILISIRVSAISPRGLAGISSIGAILFLAFCLYFYNRRPLVERIIHAAARFLDKVIFRITRRSLLNPGRVQRVIDDFYTGMSAARRAPKLVAVSVLMNLLRYIMGAATLYFSLLSVGQAVPLDVLILTYTSASMLTTLSAAPGEVAIMGSGLAILSLTPGIEVHAALGGLLLSRAMIFWLPIPLGYLMLWNLSRKHYL